MKKLIAHLALTAATAVPMASLAHAAAPDQSKMLISKDLHLAANKRLVYDFWREVLEGQHLELADKYLMEGYIQHNPNVPTGRTGFVAYFSNFAKPHAIAPTIQSPLVSIVAEGDYVVLSFVEPKVDPQDKTKTYSTTWFDMFRVEHGKIAEHWDPALKEPATSTASQKTSESAEQGIRLPEATLQGYVGQYRVTAIDPADAMAIPADMTIAISLQEGALVLNMTGTGINTNGPSPFAAKAVDHFFRPTTGSQLEFQHSSDGKISGLVLHAAGYTFKGERSAS